MKKFGLLVLSVILVFSLAACRSRKNDQQPTETTAAATTPATEPETMPVLPEIDPTLDTNIPDPNVDTSMPDATMETYDNGMDGTTNDTTMP